MAELSAQKKEEVKPKPKKDFDFSTQHHFTNSANRAKEFPTLKEASEIEQAPKKAAPSKKPAESEPYIPTFTNSKKKDDKPQFTALEEQKEFSHHGELTSSPYAGEGQREFKVRTNSKHR